MAHHQSLSAKPVLLPRALCFRRAPANARTLQVGLVCSIVAVAVIAASVLSYTFMRPSPQKKVVIEVLQSNCEGVCTAKLEGWFSDTLRLDWTPSTRRA